MAAVGVVLVTTAPVRATDQVVPGTRLALKVTGSGTEKLSFKSRGVFTVPPPGGADDPRQAGATLALVNPGTGESVTFDLPPLHWSVTPAGTLYKYRDSGLVESGKVKIALVGSRSLKVSGRKVGITLNEPSQGGLVLVLTSGSFRYCARFDGGSVTRDLLGVFSAMNAPAPVACPAEPNTTTSTATTPTSTATTFTSTSTSLTIPTISSSTTSITTTSITTTSTETTSTDTTPTTETTTTSTSTTTTLPAFCSPIVPLLPLGRIRFTTSPGTNSCSVAPFSGEIDGTTGTKLRDLGLGCLQIGAGGNRTLPPAPLTDGSNTALDVSGINGLKLTLAGSNGSGRSDCSKGPGPGRHCSTGSPGTDGHGVCTSDADCGGGLGVCNLDANCFFGPPLPVAAGALSTCVINVIGADACGAADLGSNSSSLHVALSARLYLTSNGASPCPQCDAGTCTAGQRAGLPCSGGVGTTNTSIDCPPSATQFLAALPLTLSPLTTGVSTATDPAGFFCPGQNTPGAFGLRTVRTIRQSGSPLLGGPSLFSMTVAGNFCVPSSGVGLIDSVVDLPGPGSVSVPGTAAVCLLGLLCL